MEVQGVKDRRIVVAVTGGIAAYKMCTVVSRLAQAGAEVSVIMTRSAAKFVTPLTFQTLSGRPVYTSQWQAEENHDSQHIGLARAADLMLIAPATANTIAKLAAGIADNLVLTVAMALPRKPRNPGAPGAPGAPVLLAPAMNAQMWEHPLTQRNLQTVREVLGYRTIGPAEGWQACRTSGPGRMSEPEEILAAVAETLAP